MNADNRPLKDRSCERIAGGAEPMSKVAAASLMDQVHDWNLSDDGTTLLGTFQLHDFKRAVAFINLVAQIADKENHHPNIYLHDYNSVSLTVTTRSIGGLSDNDFILAAKINALLDAKTEEDS